MNSTIDQSHHWLGSDWHGITAVQSRLRKGVPPQAPKSTPLAEIRPCYALTRLVFAIPILHDASPDTARCAEGLTIELSKVGITFDLSTTTRPVSPKWLLGVEQDDGTYGFMTVVSQNVSQTGLGLRVTAAIVSADQDPLAPANLVPTFDPNSFAFQTTLAPAVLDKWLALGVLQARLLDRMLVCPRCQSPPTFRRGCKACGSINVASQKLIHHFACAHIDYVASFECDTEIACPKCRVRKLVVGTDFEYLDGPFQCQDCDWSDTELATIARCVACGDQFAPDQAAEKEVIGYHVNRLEPLDLIAAN